MENLEKKLAKILETKIGDLKGFVSDEVSKSIDAMIKEKGLDKVEVKEIEVKKAELSEIEIKEQAAKFVNALYNNDKTSLKALSEGTGSAGGFTVPVETAAMIMRITENYGLVRKFATKFPMKSDTLDVPTVATSVTTYWKNENAAGTESDPVLANAQLTAKTQIGLTVLSEELLEDSLVDMIDYLMELFGEAMASGEDAQGLTGSGSPFTGVLNDANVNVVTLGSGDTGFTNIDLGDFRDMITRVKSSVLSTSSFIMHREIWSEVQQLKENSQSVPTFQNPIVTMTGALVGAGNGEGIQPAGYLWGYPVYLSDVMPALADSAISTEFVIFGSLKKGLFFGDRKQVSMKVSDTATVGSNNTFEANQVAFRIIERVAIKVGLPKAFSVLKTAAA